MTTTDPTTEAWDPDACAAAGAALLDNDPTWAGWRTRLDLDRLDMADGLYYGGPDCRACVGAQLHYRQQLQGDTANQDAEGDYALFLWGLAALPPGDYNERHAWQIAHGFIIPDAFFTAAEEGAAYARLTDAWRKLLTGSPS